MNSRTLFLGLIKVRFRGLFKSHSLTKWPPSVWDQGKLLTFFFSVCGAPSRLHSAQGACCGITLTFNLRPTSIYMTRRFTHDCEPTPTQKWPVTHTRDTHPRHTNPQSIVMCKCFRDWLSGWNNQNFRTGNYSWGIWNSNPIPLL